MIENGRKIRELKEAVRAEGDVRIRNRMTAVPGRAQGPPDKGRVWFCSRGPPGSTGAASAASGTLPGGAGLRAQGTAGPGGWPTGLRAGTCPPREGCGTG